MPSERLRKLEIDANYAFDRYRDMYFDGGVSSVYLWDLDHGFAGNIIFEGVRCFVSTFCNFYASKVSKAIICVLNPTSIEIIVDRTKSIMYCSQENKFFR